MSGFGQLRFIIIRVSIDDQPRIANPRDLADLKDCSCPVMLNPPNLDPNDPDVKSTTSMVLLVHMLSSKPLNHKLYS